MFGAEPKSCGIAFQSGKSPRKAPPMTTQNESMAKRDKLVQQTSIAADRNQWSKQSKRSVSFHFKREYVDEPYACLRCEASCVFTALDQKYAFEVKKASIDQRRNFCADCWAESHRMRAAIVACEERWATEKTSLRADPEFLGEWLALLTRWKDLRPTGKTSPVSTCSAACSTSSDRFQPEAAMRW